MRFIRIFLLVLIVIGLGLLATQSKWVPMLVNMMVQQEAQAPVATSSIPSSSSSVPTYTNARMGFSLWVPGDYGIDESYRYEQLGPGKEINGVKFTIPASVATGTNLGSDSYIGVEQIATTSLCSASLFIYQNVTTQKQVDGGVTYSVASTTDAAAGNRYTEILYALPATHPCIAVRYFIHYGVFENYPPGMVRKFDEQTLMAQFDAIRRTLVVHE